MSTGASKFGHYVRLYPNGDGRIIFPPNCVGVEMLPDGVGLLAQWFKPRVRVSAGRREISMDEYFMLGSQWRPDEIVRFKIGAIPITRNARPWDIWRRATRPMRDWDA